MNRYPRGSAWRKWDLHVHSPGSTMNDAYEAKDGAPDLDQFCEIVQASDVAVVAVADYFSLDGYFAVKARYEALFPDDDTLLLPNLELRLPLAVNKDAQEVNLHLVFRPTLTREEATKFLGHLKTAATTGPSKTAVTCADLQSPGEYKSATVSLDAIDAAIKATFGEHAAVPSIRQEHLLVVASAKGDGIRAGGSGAERKRLLTDEIDKFSDAFFANSGSRDWFLGTERLEGSEIAVPKPVFDGCDAHSFDDLTTGLGQHSTAQGRQRNITWIKADPTYAGLLQTLSEPEDRVAMQFATPDPKEPYNVISRVKFSGTDAFPGEVVFNRNLVAIIGSRSSGKSALLAHIAHAVDPIETVRAQVEAARLGDDRDAGPAASFTWQDVAHVSCEVEWESGEGTKGKVIYVPQNSLYRLSDRPSEITTKIAPALFRAYPAFKTVHDSATSKVATANKAIASAVVEWFDLAGQVAGEVHRIKDLGDKTAIAAERDRLQVEIDRIKRAAEVTDGELANYQAVETELSDKAARLDAISSESDQLSAYVAPSGGTEGASAVPLAVEATLTVRPTKTELPDAVADRIEELKAKAIRDFVVQVERALVDAFNALETEEDVLRHDIQSLEENHADLISKHAANEELAAVVSDHKRQLDVLAAIAGRERVRSKLIKEQQAAVAKVEKGLADRDRALRALAQAFDAEERLLTDLRLGIETEVPGALVERASAGFNQRSTSLYVKGKGDLVDYEIAQADPRALLAALYDNTVKLNKGYEARSVASEVLTLTGEVRFFAELDSDRIGGFQRSSMTPGKQALFALTLILNESLEPWPLLIDQPEDDLDSRSIYDTIVPYLTKRKKERQIIMASHNANLVIGADAEQVIVTNRHGNDRKNKDGREFEYFTGALEHSQPLNAASATTLGRFGIREHACELLDGGEEAFRKRREKYKIRSDG